MNDDRWSTDERIASAARESYHAPPPTPRDEMWSAIDARLPASDAENAAEEGAFRLPRPGGKAGWWIGIAAALLIGLGIGRLSLSSGSDDSPVAAGADTGETPVLAQAPEEGAPPVAAEEDAGTRSPAAPAEDEPQRRADGGVAAEAPPAMRDESRPGARGRLPYVVATRRHLDRSETFLAGIRANPVLEAPAPEFEAWARSLLTRTRVLMESPAGQDPATRRLLEDLELMLAQIAVTAATGDSGEARILGRGLEEGDLLYRLRSATENEGGPGGSRASGTSSL